MAGFGVVYIDGMPVVMNSVDAMYVRAQQAGDTKLMEILEERAKREHGPQGADSKNE
jgi:hypothetical protein